jgi:dTMP kinase
VNGKLLVLEGIDGAGTTTQAHRLGAYLVGQGISAHVTNEPSSGPVGTEIRKILRGAHAPFDQEALALLFAADRLDHLSREILPRLASGTHVVCDRYLLSSIVYQSRFVPADFVAAVNARARPADLTLLLDVSAEVAAARRQARGAPEEMYEELTLQRHFVEQYRALPSHLQSREHLVVVDGSPDPDTVFEVLKSCLARAGISS